MVASPPIEMANIGMADTVILMILALVVFGPRRLPQIGRQIGKLMYEFRKASNDFKFQMEEELRQAEEADRRKKEEERQKALAAAQQNQQMDPPTAAASITIPDAAAGTTQPMETATAAGEETSLHIKPPSTGETVAMNRSGLSNLPQPAAQDAAKDNAGGANNTERSEPASHHG